MEDSLAGDGSLVLASGGDEAHAVTLVLEPVAEVIREGLPASLLHWSPVAATGEVITILALALLPRYVGCEPTAGAHCPRSSANQGS